MEKIISKFELFAGLPKTVIANFHRLAVERRLAMGDVLFHQHEPGAEAFLIVTGGLRIERINEEGNRILLDIIGPGKFFGETALLTGNPRMASAVAQTDSLLLAIKTADFQKMLTLHPQMSERLMRIISGRLTLVGAKLEEAGLNSLTFRLAGILLDFMKRFADQSCQAGSISIKLTQNDLAELALSSREHINKIIKAWETDGILQANRGKITILKPEKLREFH